ncbi:hypothetical protein Tco_0411251 [Tanacetum coccineum]
MSVDLHTMSISTNRMVKSESDRIQRKFKSECSDDVLKDISKDMKCLMALIKLIQISLGTSISITKFAIIELEIHSNFGTRTDASERSQFDYGINNIQLPILICCSPRVHTFTGQDTMVPSVALWHRFADSVAGNGVGFTQLALFGGGTYFELLVYIPEASTLGFSKVVDPLLFLPLSSVFSLVFSAVKALIFAMNVEREMLRGPYCGGGGVDALSGCIVVSVYLKQGYAQRNILVVLHIGHILCPIRRKVVDKLGVHLMSGDVKLSNLHIIDQLVENKQSSHELTHFLLHEIVRTHQTVLPSVVGKDFPELSFSMICIVPNPLSKYKFGFKYVEYMSWGALDRECWLLGNIG